MITGADLLIDGGYTISLSPQLIHITGDTMQRFINNPDEVVEDTVRGFVKAHSDIIRLAENPRVAAAKDALLSLARLVLLQAADPASEPASSAKYRQEYARCGGSW